MIRRRSFACLLLASLLPSAAPAEPAEPATITDSDHRALSAAALGGAYVALGTWAWLAWYDGRQRLPAWKVGGDGLFGADTYAGGADKVGHVWSALVLARVGAEALQAGGWDELPAAVISSGLCLTALTLVEVNDGNYTELSPGDLAGDGAGVLLALAMSRWPALDEAVDLRVSWWPSPAFRERPGANLAEDYSGQTYLLAFKPGSLSLVRDASRPLAWLQFVDPVVGFETRNYRPEPPAGTSPPRTQRLFVGFTLDAQALLDATAGDGSVARAGHVFLEFVNVPFALPVATATRSEP